MGHTKNDMARVIVQALFGRPTLPAADHGEVLAIARRPMETLERHYGMALDVLAAASRTSKGLREAPADRTARYQQCSLVEDVRKGEVEDEVAPPDLLTVLDRIATSNGGPLVREGYPYIAIQRRDWEALMKLRGTDEEILARTERAEGRAA